MRLLLDSNLSRRLVCRLVSVYPGIAHAASLGLLQREDKIIWEYAKNSGHIIVSKDRDFLQMTALHGYPPKIIWLQVGNLGTQGLADLLIQKKVEIEEFSASSKRGLLILAN